MGQPPDAESFAMNTLRIAVPLTATRSLASDCLITQSGPSLRSTRTVRLETPPVRVVKAGDSPVGVCPAVLR